MMKIEGVVAAAIAGMVACPAWPQEDFEGHLLLDFFEQANIRHSSTRGSGCGLTQGGAYPTGLQEFDGVPFLMGSESSFAWTAPAPSTSNFHRDCYPTTGPELRIDVTPTLIRSAAILVCTYNGACEQGVMGAVQFQFESGDEYSFDLVGDLHLRDHNSSSSCSVTTSSDTSEVWRSGSVVIDMTRIALPPHYDDPLVSVSLMDATPDDGRSPLLFGLSLQIDADCNDDGIGDYGQILDGTFADEDGDGVPDLCDAVQWRVEDGGNGHWYTVTAELIEREAARLLAEERGGYLATPKSAAENDFLHARLTEASSDSAASCWLGLAQLPDSREPDGGWTWIDGSPLKWARWAPGEPNNQNYAGTVTGSYLAEMYLGGPNWADTGGPTGSGVGHAAIEWSADCNGDGIVDYGQILDGTFADLNRNGVPDCCEVPCDGDLNLDNRVDSADLGLLVAAWNTDGSIVAGSDVNGDGTVNAADLGLLIGAWGDCGGCN